MMTPDEAPDDQVVKEILDRIKNQEALARAQALLATLDRQDRAAANGSTMRLPNGRLPVRLHAQVTHPRHKGTGVVTELTAFPDAAGMAFVAWPREGYDVTWLGAETLHVVRYRTPSSASKRRLAAKIAKDRDKS